MGNKGTGGTQPSPSATSASSALPNRRGRPPKKSGLFASVGITRLFRSLDDDGTREALQGVFDHRQSQPDFLDPTTLDLQGPTLFSPDYLLSPTATAAEGDPSLSGSGEFKVAAMFTTLPLVKNKYRVLSFLGKGAFGSVVKVSYSGRLYALKVIEVKKGMSTPDSDALRAEVSFLEESQLRHVNIVEFVESFELDFNPLEVSLAPRVVEVGGGGFQDLAQKRRLKKTWICVVLEYVRGSSLNRLLELAEEKKLMCSAPLTIRWFLELLSAFRYLASKDILHRDVKPDNIMIYYEGELHQEQKRQDSKTLQSMQIKLCDFGVGCMMGDRKFNQTTSAAVGDEPEAEGELGILGDLSDLSDISSPRSIGEGQAIRGAVFFSSPEVLLKQEYDARCDVWSLGLVFHMMFFGVSQKSYDAAVRRLLTILSSDEEMRAQYCQMWGKDDVADGELDYALLMAFFAKKGIVWNEVIAPAAETVPCVGSVLEKMICRKDERLTIEEIGNLKEVLTWKYVLGMFEDEEEQGRAGLALDLDSIFLLLRSAGPADTEVVKKCLQVIVHEARVDLSGEKGRQVVVALFRQRAALLRDPDIGWLAVQLFDLILAQAVEDRPNVIRRLSVGVRTFSFLPVLDQFVSRMATLNPTEQRYPDELKRHSLVSLIVALSENSPTIARQFGHMCIGTCVASLLGGKSEFESMISLWMPAVNEISIIQSLLGVGDRIVDCFGSGPISDGWRNSDIAPQLVELCGVALGRLSDELDDPKSEKRILNALRLLLRLCFTVRRPASDLRLHLSPTAKDSVLEIKSGRGIGGHLELDELDTTFTVKSLPGTSVLRSSQRLYSVPSSGEEEAGTGGSESKVVAYYELKVLEGGMNDYIQLGVSISGKQFMLEPSRFTFIAPSVFGGGVTTDSLGPELYPLHSGSICGIGLTADRHMFVTLNGNVLNRSMMVCPLEGVTAEILITKNRNLKATVNFGTAPFVFPFANCDVPAAEVDSLVKILQSMPSLDSTLDRLQERESFKDLIVLLREKISEGDCFIDEAKMEDLL